jgi:ribosomal protein S18 acetylase RimI-like enzyme
LAILEARMSDFSIRLLDETTWPDFARLVEANNGVWGGCWCIGFHEEGASRDPNRNHREQKARRVREGRAHAALVFDGEDCVGWCQYGSPVELPRIKHRRAYEADLRGTPDWRITCFFVGKGHRGRGVAEAALAGALEAIARAGGGRVESFPEDAEGRKVAGAFLHNASLAMFERHGFERERQIGKHRWVVRRDVAPAAQSA